MSGRLPGLIYGLSLNQATLPTGGGLIVGQTIIVNGPNGEGFLELMLVKAFAPITANAALKFVDDAFSVDETSAAGDVASGVNDVSFGTAGTGALIAAGNYFLMSIRGNVSPDVAAATPAGPLAVSAVPGQLVAWADGVAVFTQTNLISLAASGAGGPTPCFLS